MIEEQILDNQDYEGDFWPGFVDILSGLILIFAFLILVAGIVIAIIFKVDATVIEPPQPFQNILTVLQESPLVVPARFDIIERIKEGDEVQVLVEQTKQQLEEVARETYQVLENYPVLERKLVQEIRFLQREIKLVTESPPQRGTTQLVRDFEGGRIEDTGVGTIAPNDTGWDISVIDNGQAVEIVFNDASAAPPDDETDIALRQTVSQWLRVNGFSSITIAVANADVTYSALAQRESLNRAIFMRNILRRLNGNLSISIETVENDDQTKTFGWIKLIPSP